MTLVASIRSPVVRGVLWSTAGTVASRGIALAASILAARVLGREAFGAFGLVTATGVALQALAGLGLGIAVIKFVSEELAAPSPAAGPIVTTALTLCTITGVGVAGLVALGASWIATFALAAPELAPAVRAASLSLPPAALWGVQSGVLVGMRRFRAFSTASMVVGLCSAAGTVLGAQWGGVSGAVFGLGAGSAVAAVAVQGILHAEARRSGVRLARGSTGLAARLTRLAFPSFLAGFVVTPTTWVCAAILARRADGLGELGTLSAANQWFGALLLVPTMVSQVMLPEFSQRLASRDIADIRTLLRNAMVANLLIGAAVAVVLSVGGPLLLRLYGPSFRGGVPTLVLSVGAAVLVAVQSPIAQVLAAADRMWWSVWANAGWALLTILLTLWLVPGGAFGVAGARFAAYLVHTVVLFAVARRLLATFSAIDTPPHVV